jgi:predicted ATPase
VTPHTLTVLEASKRPFVGRERELEELRTALGSAASGCGRLVLVHGEAGIGKTRLLHRFAEDAQAAGTVVRWGRCYEREGAPVFWPWLQILRAETESHGPADLRAVLGEASPDIAHLVPELREQVPYREAVTDLDTPDGRFRLFDSVVDVLRRASAQAPRTLLLDDLQGADRPSLLLLEFIAQALDSLP